MDKPNDNPQVAVTDALGLTQRVGDEKAFRKFLATKKKQLGSAYPGWQEKNGGLAGVRDLYSRGQ